MTTASCQYPGIPVSRNNLVKYGPTLETRVGFDSLYQPNLGLAPNVPKELIPALVDTGAYASCVDSQLAENLGLPYSGKIPVSGSAGLKEHKTYIGQIYIPSLKFALYGRFSGVDLLAGKQPHVVLLGRDLLKYFRMVYDGQKGTVLIDRCQDPDFLART